MSSSLVLAPDSCPDNDVTSPLLAALGEVLRLAARCHDLPICLQVGTLCITLGPREAKQEGPDLFPSRRWFFCSGIEREMLLALVARGTLTREQLAREVGEELGGKLKNLIPNLVARRWLVNGKWGLQINAEAADVQEWLVHNAAHLPAAGND